MTAQKSVPYLGMISPIPSETTRFTADHVKVVSVRLARAEKSWNDVSVVAAFPQWAETYRLNRYPSPDRRPCAIVHGPPFFVSGSTPCSLKRGFAQNRPPHARGFDPRGRIALSARTENHNTRGTFPCDAVEHFRSHLCLWAAWPPAVKPSVSRPLSGPQPGLAQPQLLAGPCLPVRPSVRRGTSPIVRSPSRTVAGYCASAPRAAAGPLTPPHSHSMPAPTWSRARKPNHRRGSPVAVVLLCRSAPAQDRGGKRKGDVRCSRKF